MEAPNPTTSKPIDEHVSKDDLQSVIGDIKSQIKQYGITAVDLGFGAAARRGTRDVPVAGREAGAKVIHPITGKCWSGRGICPQWVKDLDLEVHRSTEPDSLQGLAAKAASAP